MGLTLFRGTFVTTPPYLISAPINHGTDPGIEERNLGRYHA